MLGHTHNGERDNARTVWVSWAIYVASLDSLGSGEQQFILCLEESDYASRNTFLTNTSRSEGETGGGSKSEAGTEPEKLPEVQQPVTLKAKHGLPMLPDYGVEVLQEDY